jgi:hypothetical protein
MTHIKNESTKEALFFKVPAMEITDLETAKQLRRDAIEVYNRFGYRDAMTNRGRESTDTQLKYLETGLHLYNKANNTNLTIAGLQEENRNL